VSQVEGDDVFTLPSRFWSSFAKRFWGRRPTLIPRPFLDPIVSPHDVLRAFRAAGQRLPPEDFALRIDGRRPPASRLTSWLPRPSDGSVRRYLARLGPRRDGGRLSGFARDFQVDLGWEPWDRFRSFLTPVYAACGAPTDRAEIALFLGDYAATPGGLHADAANVLCFVVEGRKRFRLWPPRALRHLSPTRKVADYGSMIGRSICLEAGAGDIVYWPPSYWHVAEPRGPSASLSLALYAADETPRTGPRERGRTDVAAARSEMDRETGFAFAVPPPEPGRLRCRDAVRGAPQFPILHRRIGRSAIVSASGRSLVLPALAGLEAVVQVVNEGTPHRVGEVIDLMGRGGSHAAEARALLRFLIRQRALRRC
jgi:hypothetical protein